MIGRYAAKLSLVLVIIGLIGIYEAIQQRQEDKAFASRALTSIAEPAGTVKQGESYQGNLVFITKSGETVTIPAAHVPSPIRDGFRVAKNVEIKYLPENPTTVRFSDWDRPGANSSKGLIQAGILFAAGLIAFLILRRSAK
jgi:hypothetical protein